MNTDIVFSVYLYFTIFNNSCKDNFEYKRNDFTNLVNILMNLMLKFIVNDAFLTRLYNNSIINYNCY